MPIYAYKCESCGHAKDILQKMSDPLLTECPQCGAAAFTKQVTAAGFQLKGSGWYVTDFKNGAAAGTAAPKGPEPDAPAATASAAEGQASAGASANAVPAAPSTGSATASAGVSSPAPAPTVKSPPAKGIP